MIGEEFVVILLWQVYSGKHKGNKRVERCSRREVQRADDVHSIFSSTRRETGDQSYSAQHCCAGRKWCDISRLC